MKDKRVEFKRRCISYLVELLLDTPTKDEVEKAIQTDAVDAVLLWLGFIDIRETLPTSPQKG